MLPECDTSTDQNDTIQFDISCVEGCVQNRYNESVLANSAFPTLSGCSDPINVAFLYAPQLIKSCLDSTFDCSTATPPCKSGCYDCITDCFAVRENGDDGVSACFTVDPLS